MHQSTTGERLTAVISTLVAVALLGAAVTAQQPPPPHADRLASLESDLRYQLDMALRHDGAAHKTRIAELDATLAAWRESPQSPDDNQLLADWLEAAIDQSMPGSSGELPTRPEFGAEPPIIVTPPAPVNVEEPAATPEPALVEITTAPEPAPPVVEEPAEVIEPFIVAVSEAEPLATESAVEPAAPPEHSIAIAPAATTTQTTPAELVDSTPVEAVVDASQPPPISPYELTPAEPTSEPEVAQPAAVQVNLAELNARIGGYHQQLAETEAALVAEEEPTPQRLEALVGEVEELAAQYQFISLYHESLSEAERMHVEPLRGMGDVLALATGLAGRDADFLADFDAEASEEPTLAERLSAVADAVGAPAEESR